jgi:hypothetical protein
MDDLTEFDPESLLLSYVILKHILSEDDCLQFSYSSVYPNNVTVHGSRLPPEVPDNQSSILCNDQDGQNNVTMVSTNSYSNLLQCPLN